MLSKVVSRIIAGVVVITVFYGAKLLFNLIKKAFDRDNDSSDKDRHD